MADNFRIKIEDLEGTGSLHSSKEKEEQSSALPNKEPASGSQSFNGSKLYSNSSGNSSIITLESSSSSLSRDVSKETFETDIHTDIYSEDPALSYNLSESDAEYAEMVAALGDAYGKIFNIDTEDVNTATGVDGICIYNRTLDPNKMNALAKQLIYGTLKEVLSDMNANGNGSTGPGSNGGGSGNGTGDGYSGINEEGSNSSNSATKPFDINIPISNLGIGTDPYVKVLPAIDNAIDELYSTEVDYQNTNENVDATDILDVNPSYGKVEHTEANLDHTGKWDLRAMPDAMSNMYDVYFRIVDNDTDVDGIHLTPGLAGVDSLFSSRLLSARISFIEIPAYERQTTEVSAWGGRVERPTDVINTPGQSSFSIRGDTRLLYIDFMNILSGTPMADYLNVGSAVFDLKDKLSCSRTANYIKEASKDVKDAKEKMAEAIAAIKKKEDEELEDVRNKIISEYSNNLKDEQQRDDFMRQAEERSKNTGIPLYAAELEMIEESGNAQVAALKKKLKEVKAKENDGCADNFWAVQKEKKKQMSEIKAEIKKLQKEQEARDKKISDVTKEAAKALRNAKAKKNATVISAYLRNRPVAVEQNWTEASAYVTGAIARNMSIRGTAAPFSSFEDLSNHSRVDIIVRRVPQGERFNSIATPKKDERFIFEDVKLLGTSNAIQFKRENADTQDFTYNFIYKRFYKLDYYADNPADWVSSQLDSLANWCVDWTNDRIKNGASELKSLLKG